MLVYTKLWHSIKLNRMFDEDGRSAQHGKAVFTFGSKRSKMPRRQYRPTFTMRERPIPVSSRQSVRLTVAPVTPCLTIILRKRDGSRTIRRLEVL